MQAKYYIDAIIRYVYYKFHINKLYNPYKRRKRNHYKLTLEDLETILDAFDVKHGDSIMVHSAMSYIDETAEAVISFLKNYIGENGNILMPSHPLLSEENGIKVYDISNSKSTVGYLTEVFRKSAGVKRSQHPFSSIAVWGKERDYFLENNLNLNKPLPHGIDSPYYKFAQKNGKAILLGVTPRSATIRHTAEEILDSEFNIPNFFKSHNVIVKDKNRLIGKYTVRHTDLRMSQLYISRPKVSRDWLNNGVLKTIDINGVPISCVLCKDAVEVILREEKKGNSYYPLAPKKKK